MCIVIFEVMQFVQLPNAVRSVVLEISQKLRKSFAMCIGEAYIPNIGMRKGVHKHFQKCKHPGHFLVEIWPSKTVEQLPTF